MKAYCLGSSSSGNCYLIEFKNKVKIMVECGLPYKTMLSRSAGFNINPAEYDLVFITHSHNDHCCCYHDLATRNYKLYMSEETASKLGSGTILQTYKCNQINGVDLKVITFPVEHDCDGAVGFIFKAEDETILFINDFKSFDTDIKGIKFDYVFIECNYYHTMVYAQYNKKLKEYNSGNTNGTLKAELKHYERVIKVHSSLATTIRALRSLDLEKCKAIFLMHLSEHNSAPLIMVDTIRKEFNKKVYLCLKNGGIR